MSETEGALEILITRLDPGLELPSYAHPGDAGLDLFARVGVRLAPGERETIPTGIAVAIPAGYVGLVHPRSGLAAKRGLTVLNSPGTVDAGYRGEIAVTLINLDPREVAVIERGDRIAQIVFQAFQAVRLVEAETLPGSARGTGGFGSSGVRGGVLDRGGVADGGSPASGKVGA
jgi:dUTP pyrophosphatase